MCRKKNERPGSENEIPSLCCLSFRRIFAVIKFAFYNNGNSARCGPFVQTDGDHNLWYIWNIEIIFKWVNCFYIRQRLFHCSHWSALTTNPSSTNPGWCSNKVAANLSSTLTFERDKKKCSLSKFTPLKSRRSIILNFRLFRKSSYFVLKMTA